LWGFINVNSSAFGMPARRAAAVLTATALAAGPAVLLGVVPAHATDADGGEGKAGAVVLRTGLDVNLLDKTANVPLHTSVNEVHAPADADKTTLTVRLDGVDNGRPVNVLRADVATARATADRHRSEGYANLAHAKVHVPGLPLLSLIEVEQVTSKAVCEAGERPTAESNVLGSVLVLGKKVTLSSGGTTRVEAPGVGEVRLDLSKTETTSRTAAAAALELSVSVNPLKRNVAEVAGRVTLAEATCESPEAAPKEEQPQGGQPQAGQPQAGQPRGEQRGDGKSQADKPQEEGLEADKHDISPQGGAEDLAETGGSSTTPYVAGGAALLIAAGGGALMLTRRHRSAAARGRG
jgi:LPXTG-motif cell wall-anchored protein